MFLLQKTSRHAFRRHLLIPQRSRLQIWIIPSRYAEIARFSIDLFFLHVNLSIRLSVCCVVMCRPIQLPDDPACDQLRAQFMNYRGLDQTFQAFEIIRDGIRALDHRSPRFVLAALCPSIELHPCFECFVLDADYMFLISCRCSSSCPRFMFACRIVLVADCTSWLLKPFVS